MKKLLAIMLSVAMVLSLVAVLAACGSTTDNETKPTDTESTKEPGDSTKPTETEKTPDSESGKASETEKQTKESRTRKPTETIVNPTFDVVKLSTAGSIVIDGDVDLAYEAGQPLFCGVEECKAWTANNTDEKAIGGGIVGAPELAESYTNEDFAEYFYFAFDDEYMYICEYRVDNTPNYTANTFRQPYAGDGSLIWFVKDQGSTPVGGIQWNAAVKGAGAGEGEYSETPVFGWFTGDNQGTSQKKDWENKLEQFEDHYCLEVKIPLTDMGFTAADIEAGKMGFTFCTVDVVSDYDGDTNKLWVAEKHAYQLQFPGVNNWRRAYQGKVVAEPDPTLAAANAAIKAAAVSAFKYTLGQSGTQAHDIKPEAVDLSAAKKVKLTFEVVGEFDLSALAGNGQFEIASSGKCDYQEVHWDIVNTLKGQTPDAKGQFSVEFDLSSGRNDGNPDGGAPVAWNAVNYMRIYMAAGDTSITPTAQLNLIDIAFS